MSAPKYLRRDSIAGQLKEVVASESGPAVESVVATGEDGLISSSLLPNASASITQVTVDVGSIPVDAKEVVVTDTACTVTSKILASLAYVNTSDNDADEIEMSKVSVAAGLPTDGSFTVSLVAADGPITGHFAVNYTL